MLLVDLDVHRIAAFFPELNFDDLFVNGYLHPYWIDYITQNGFHFLSMVVVEGLLSKASYDQVNIFNGYTGNYAQVIQIGGST